MLFCCNVALLNLRRNSLLRPRMEKKGEKRREKRRRWKEERVLISEGDVRYPGTVIGRRSCGRYLRRLDPATTRPWPLACENYRKLNYPKWPVTGEARAIRLSRISPICRYTVINFAYRRLARKGEQPKTRRYRSRIVGGAALAHRAFLFSPPLDSIL